MLKLLAKKVIGTANDRYLRSVKPLVSRVNELEAKYEKFSDEDLARETVRFKERLKKGESLDSIEPEAFAVVREASKRTLGMRHFDVQIIGGHVLHQGKIAEMKTGEGKTLVATLAAYLNALEEKGVHIVTVNDYLAKRDAEWMGQIYKFLGLSVGVVYSGMEDSEKKAAYQADITYGQNNEFGFDYLRDNLKFSLEDMYQRGHHYAIVDEVDSILIDEARTPLIISGPAEDATELYYKIDKIIPKLKEGKDYEIDLKSKQPTLTEEGVAHVEKLLNIENLYDPQNIDILHHVNQALKAHTTLKRDVDYVVKDGQVIIVDEFTGRLMPGRRWSDGLHQAVEAKEGLKIARENITLASITFQNYFRMYEKLSGMTGTADTEAAEFKEIYGLDVVVVPTNEPMIRDDQSDEVYRTRKEKYEAVVNLIKELHQKGQPVLVGTISIEQSETLSRLLTKEGIPHNVLNAKHHEREAEIIAQAGRLGAVTISTNMAGRGTDIMLGGNPEFLAAAEAGTKDKSDPDYQAALKKYKEICQKEKEEVIKAGGLFVIGTERHESRRIDNQLRGRSGRQGDPGASRFFVSLEDDLMKRFGGEGMQNLMQKFGWQEGLALNGRLISRTIENAQKRVEAFHFEARKHITEYDDVLNKQRQVVYDLRHRILKGENLREEIFEMIDDLLEDLVLSVCDEKTRPVEWDLNKIKEGYKYLFNSECQLPQDIPLNSDAAQKIFDTLRAQAKDLYKKRTEELNNKLKELEKLPVSVSISEAEGKPLTFETVEQDTLLEILDKYWNEHLTEMEQLREGIGLRGYGQKDPKHEYQREGFLLFQKMLENVKTAVIRRLYYYEVPEPEVILAHIEEEQRRREQLERRMKMLHGEGEEDASSESTQSAKEVRAKLKSARKKRKKQKKKR
ncbi:MAG: preprotein translocase subunit SecA [Candidatus Dadabacteria bacterium]|nr:MAG: preprotein translocase subunit SecA [Candidatus Dadabacteria bacterium]